MRVIGRSTIGALLLGLLLLAACATARSTPERQVAGLGLTAPAVPVILDPPFTRIINSQQLTTTWSADVLVRWSHARPPGTVWYQVWRSDDEPYFEPATCAACVLEGTTTAQRWVSAAPGLEFTPDWWNPAVTIRSDFETYRVVACNQRGCSAASAPKAVVTYSVNQGIPEPFNR